ncbi:single-stranded DNA-binding protein [Leuconostocaceae bacterium ESL0958]|nr:single-stranded DNA-binding protein [Leuconostocaceae bacterium ESL0958]
MINRVVLMGRLTNDADLRYTQSGVAVASFTLAVNRNFKTQNGDREADFIRCIIWRKSAENFANFTGKGAPVAVEGRLQTRNYENNQGQRVYVTEVVVDNFSLIESKADSEQRRAQNEGQAPTAGNQGFGNQGQSYNGTAEPFASQQNNSSQPGMNQAGPTPFGANNNAEIDISEDDLPF